MAVARRTRAVPAQRHKITVMPEPESAGKVPVVQVHTQRERETLGVSEQLVLATEPE
ncbi:hypothetical protein GCM10023228_23380 [Brevibacillus fulvus]